MQEDAVARAQGFIWCNARLLERYLFAYHFAGGSKEPVLAALAAYQNKDGGFGNALEPDKRAPTSQPVDAEWALHVLDLVDSMDHPMVSTLCDWLDVNSTPEGGVPFALPSVTQYPRAPWWSVDANPPASLNPTTAIVGLLLKHSVQHPWIERATAFCWHAIAESDSTWYHDVIPVVAFLEHTPDRERAEHELERVKERISAPEVIELDPAATDYVKKPLDWAPSPSSPLRSLFEDAVIHPHLEALAAQQQPDGGWPISWETIGPGVTLEWRGWVTIQALRTLQAYGVLESK